MYLKRFIVSSLAVLFCSKSLAGPLEYYFQRALEEKNQPTAILKSPALEKRFEQLINHNIPSLGTFSQRYFVDETFGPSNYSPVFLYVCGEGACSPNELNGAIRQYAKKYKAKLVALEHRYYGESQPYSTLTTKHLNGLSTQAALDDLAYFQRSIQRENNWKGRWVVFGGSYAGALAAYYRLGNPELVEGALASSAPVMAKEDFYEYDAHVAEVAGPVCAENIRQVTAEVEQAIKSANPARLIQIKALFHAEEIVDPDDFLYAIADVAATSIQYGKHQAFCAALAKHESPIEGYAAFAETIYKDFNLTPVELTPQSAMSENAEDYKHGIGMRQWYYQSCTEQGYWQNVNTDPQKSTRSSRINNQYHRKVCQRLFGLTSPANTEAFNHSFYYPLLHESVSRIYFTNGANDPWARLSLSPLNYNATNKNLAYTIISGAAHCEDLRPPRLTDSDELVAAREKMDNLLFQWLVLNPEEKLS
ncbi:S28 family serine protease [Legionella impletisoli]|uniref:Serine carboxypeptidase n=1 Tax=Legionella impletisoli TaxID=343510 RepID=A0A917K1I1_9GAMM|nr:S28 family serine protease [Legionella impletisoli]GGI93583.1 hypothetical protein GCM10007966_22720 [Legionella impletisoli]